MYIKLSDYDYEENRDYSSIFRVDLDIASPDEAIKYLNKAVDKAILRGTACGISRAEVFTKILESDNHFCEEVNISFERNI